MLSFFRRLFSRQNKSSVAWPASTVHGGRFRNFALVLLPQPQPPRGAAIIRAFPNYAPASLTIMEKDPDTWPEHATALSLSTGENIMIGHMNFPVPNREAENFLSFSMGSHGDDGASFPKHQTHGVVMMDGSLDHSLIELQTRFTWIVAAIVEASGALGVYWGDAGATHPAEFFLNMARETELGPRLMLWNGFSAAAESNDRASFLSRGMEQLGYPNFYLVVSKANCGDAIEFMLDLLLYSVNLGHPIPEGNTVGRTADQRLPVRYVTSPIDPGKKVAQVEWI